jgi:sulfoxide reductase heme-binding subunit YedZ
MKQSVPGRRLVWLALAAPAIVVLIQYARDVMGYGEVVHFTGEWSARLLILTLAVTPLRLLFPRAGWTLWLVRHRRALGVATFGYAAFHLTVYLLRKMNLDLIVHEGSAPDLAVGWGAFVILAVLALTSNDASVRQLKRAWKPLHRFVYPAAVLTFAHWILAAFDPLSGIIHAAVLAAIETTRIILQRRRQRTVT